MYLSLTDVARCNGHTWSLAGETNLATASALACNYTCVVCTVAGTVKVAGRRVITDLSRVLGGTNFSKEGFLINGRRSSFSQQLGIVRNVKLVTLEALQTCKSSTDCNIVSMTAKAVSRHSRLERAGKKVAACCLFEKSAARQTFKTQQQSLYIFETLNPKP